MRAVISVMIGAVMAAWLFFAWVLFTFECGDNCGGGQAESWKYAGQFLIAAAGSLFAVWALVLGFRRRERAYHALVALSVGCAVIWAGWSMTGEF